MVSSLAGEALALNAVIGSGVYFKSLLQDIFGPKMMKMPIVVYTDSRNLFRAVHSTGQVEDDWLIVDVAVAKEALLDGTVESVRRVSSQDMLADCLTKAGASPEKLLKVITTGEYEMPEGIQEEVNA